MFVDNSQSTTISIGSSVLSLRSQLAGMKTRLLKVITNKYFLAPVLMLVWVFFFDANNFFTQLESREQLRKLRDERVYYQERIEEVRKNYKELSSNPQTMEKYARERYFMKKANEEIFLVVEESRKKAEEKTWIPKTLRDFFSKKDTTELK